MKDEITLYDFTTDEFDEYEERSAIRQYDGCLPKDLAEEMALADIIRNRRCAKQLLKEIKDDA